MQNFSGLSGLGTYLLQPIMDVVCEKYELDKDYIRNTLKDYVSDLYIGRIPFGYFPEDGSWFDCDKGERKPGERRKYYAHPNPLFR